MINWVGFARAATRRQVLRAALVTGATCLLGICEAKHASAQESLSESEANVDVWMSEWMSKAKRAAQGGLHLLRFPDRMYVLTKPIGWSPNPGQKGEPVHVPLGFVTDFASIPQVFWSLLPPDGSYTYPAIIHDYLYWAQPTSRDQADQVFKWSMQDFSIGIAVSESIYQAVRWAGESAWLQNRELRASGEQRILRVWPDDPLIRWEEWKKRPGVFAGP
jgi:hypothetical protein